MHCHGLTDAQLTVFRAGIDRGWNWERLADEVYCAGPPSAKPPVAREMQRLADKLGLKKQPAMQGARR